MIPSVLIGLGLWLLIFLPSSAIGGLLSKTRLRKNAALVGAVVQVLFIVLSILVVLFLFGADFKSFGFKVDVFHTLNSLTVSLPIALLLAFLSSLLTKSEAYKPRFLPENFLFLALSALLLAPLAEELVYRGVLEGYLLKSTSTWVAIALPAALFALQHITPFSSAPRKVLVLVVVNALVLGILAGYYRAAGQSIMPAITVHATFNLAGIVVEKVCA